MCRLLVVTGTGTGIGKTHLAEALLGALAPSYARVIGLKPIESGLEPATISDAARLERCSTFHVEPFGHLFAEAISPHLAARRAGEVIALEPIVAAVDSIRNEADYVVVELPGGLFTPLSDTVLNADLARDLDPDLTLLATADRVGALHDTLATLRAADSISLPISAVIVIAPERGDASTGTNAAEIQRLTRVPLVLALPRARSRDLVGNAAIQRIAHLFDRGPA